MIELRDLTKSFRTVHGRHYVFRNLSLTFTDGVNIGLIGPNGAGKSTLMRIIGGIDVPDSGSVMTNQRISFPVGLSGGFQGTLSGRDNAKFVCRLYGVTPQQVRDKVNFVEEFAELGKYFDMPIKTYSSGMRSRLIFGLSMAFDFDYYLMDEVGAVGDAGFKEKSRELLASKIGTANVICVSHNMNVIREQCNLVVLLRGGEAALYSDVEEGIRAYQGDAYVQPAASRGTRSKPLNIETITPRDIKKARRVLRVVRRARRSQAEARSPEGLETTLGGFGAPGAAAAPTDGKGSRTSWRTGAQRRKSEMPPCIDAASGGVADGMTGEEWNHHADRRPRRAGESGAADDAAGDVDHLIPAAAAEAPGLPALVDNTASGGTGATETPCKRPVARGMPHAKGSASAPSGSRVVSASDTKALGTSARESRGFREARPD